MKSHMAFIALAEILRGLFGPKIRLGEKHPVRIAGIDSGSDLFEDRMGLREVFATGAFTLDKKGNGVEAQTVDAHVEPIRHHIEHRFEDPGIVEIQVWLMRVEAMPIESFCLIVPGPVRLFRVEKNDRGVL